MAVETQSVIFFLSLLCLVVLSGVLYRYLPNAPGASQDQKGSPTWHLERYLERQPQSTQMAHKRITALVNPAKSILGIISMILIFSQKWTYSRPVWGIVAFCWSLAFILEGLLDAVMVRAALSKWLWVGEQQFVTGIKVKFGGYCKIGLCLFMIVTGLWGVTH